MQYWLIFLAIALQPLSAKEPLNPPKSVALFSPPRQWQYAKPKNESAHVQVGFVGSGSHFFHPSINLATEEFEGTLKEYVKAVKAIHLAEANTSWRDLGKFLMRGGEGRLTEICSPSPFGEVKMLQAILLKEHTVYILTAAVLKKDFSQLQKEILESLHSLSFHPDLFSALSNPDQKAHVEKLYASLKTPASKSDEKKAKWEKLQKEIIQGCPEMGGHWHYLALKEGHDRIFSADETENGELPR